MPATNCPVYTPFGRDTWRDPFCLGAAAARLQGRVVLDELLAACPGFVVDAEAGVFADGAFTRRYESLPFSADGL